MPHEEIDRDEEERINTVTRTRQVQTSENIITGPLGLWQFPLLNIILASVAEQSRSTVRTEQQTKLTVTEVRRDEDGRIQAIEEFEK